MSSCSHKIYILTKNIFSYKSKQNLAKGTALYKKGEDDEPINYFVDILPRMRSQYGKDVKIYEFVQEPGETVFVPGGWWHAVINLEDSVAVTQNFVSRMNFPAVWRKTRTGRKRMAIKWLGQLDEKMPELGTLARKLNEMDQFHMMTEEERKERKRRRKEKKQMKKEKDAARDKKKKAESLGTAGILKIEKRKGDNKEDFGTPKRGRR